MGDKRVYILYTHTNGTRRVECVFQNSLDAVAYAEQMDDFPYWSIEATHFEASSFTPQTPPQHSHKRAKPDSDAGRPPSPKDPGYGYSPPSPGY